MSTKNSINNSNYILNLMKIICTDRPYSFDLQFQSKNPRLSEASNQSQTYRSCKTRRGRRRGVKSNLKNEIFLKCGLKARNIFV